MNINAISFENGRFYGHTSFDNLAESFKQVHIQTPGLVDIKDFETHCLMQNCVYVKVCKVLNDNELKALEFIPSQIEVIYE